MGGATGPCDPNGALAEDAAGARHAADRVQRSSILPRPLASLLLDECMAWGVSRMRRRAARTGRFAGLVAPIDDLIGQRIMATGWFEATQIEAVQRLIDDPDFIGFQLRPNGALVDVGANIGLYSIAFARCFQRVLAIEANPTTFAVLQANMALKQLSQVACVCAAASDRAGEAVLHVPENGNLGWATLEHRPETKRTAQAVSCRSLDDIVREHLDGQRVALVKIDVEGHEPKVLEGGRGMLARDRPVVLFEVSYGSAGGCARLLRSVGYSRFLRFRRSARSQAPSGLFTRGLGVRAEPVVLENTQRAAMICAVPAPAGG
jgi:FkbM family methyltransferase